MSEMISLYVKNLNPDVEVSMLYQIFSQKGELSSIRICQDPSLKKALGYAYINFRKPKGAKLALETFNFHILNNQPIQITLSSIDISEQKSSDGHILIKNIDEKVEHMTFYDIFLAHGDILSCNILTDENDKSRSLGYVHYRNKDSTTLAVNALNGEVISGKQIEVTKFQPTFTEAEYQEFTNVFVKNFGEHLDDDGLYSMFEQFGKITSAKVMMYDRTRKSKGFGFVCFRDPASAEAAVKALNGVVFKGLKLFCGPAQKKEERLKSIQTTLDLFEKERKDLYSGPKNVYVNNLEDSIDKEELKAMFDPFGEITSAVVMMDKNGDSKGFGFVCFTNATEANEAIEEMDGKKVHSKRLFVELARPNNSNSRLRHESNETIPSEEILHPRVTSKQLPQQIVSPPPPNISPKNCNVFPLTNQPMMFAPHTFVPMQGWCPPQLYPIMPNTLRPNFPMPLTPQMPPASPAMTPQWRGQNNLGFNQFCRSPNSTQELCKLRLRESLYEAVCGFNQLLAHKITNILLELNEKKLFHLLQDKSAFKTKVAEIVAIIQPECDSSSSSSEEEDSSCT